MTDHRAVVSQDADGTWRVECTTCGTSPPIDQRDDAEFWAGGHDSAVVCAQDVAERAKPIFPPVGPGQAVPLWVLGRTIAGLVARGLGELEIVAPLGQARRLHVLTTPTEEGWRRDLVGEISLRADGQFHAYPHAELVGGGEDDQ